MVVYWRDAGWEEQTVFVQSQLLIAVDGRLSVVRLGIQNRKHNVKMSGVKTRSYKNGF